jgi:hypothetical protein
MIFIMQKISTVDAASSVYFLGRKANSRVGPLEMIQYYQGAQ